MKQLINEISRMQKLAGIIKEGSWGSSGEEPEFKEEEKLKVDEDGDEITFTIPERGLKGDDNQLTITKEEAPVLKKLLQDFTGKREKMQASSKNGTNFTVDPEKEGYMSIYRRERDRTATGSKGHLRGQQSVAYQIVDAL